jgi:hypothetical protein
MLPPFVSFRRGRLRLNPIVLEQLYGDAIRRRLARSGTTVLSISVLEQSMLEALGRTARYTNDFWTAYVLNVFRYWPWRRGS